MAEDGFNLDEVVSIFMQNNPSFGIEDVCVLIERLQAMGIRHDNPKIEELWFKASQNENIKPEITIDQYDPKTMLGLDDLVYDHILEVERDMPENDSDRRELYQKVNLVIGKMAGISVAVSEEQDKEEQGSFIDSKIQRIIGAGLYHYEEGNTARIYVAADNEAQERVIDHINRRGSKIRDIKQQDEHFIIRFVGEADVLWLDILQTTEEYRNKGLGNKLMWHVLKYSATPSRVELRRPEHIEATVQAYKSWGFFHIGKNFLEVPDDIDLMEFKQMVMPLSKEALIHYMFIARKQFKGDIGEYEAEQIAGITRPLSLQAFLTIQYVKRRYSLEQIDCIQSEVREEREKYRREEYTIEELQDKENSIERRVYKEYLKEAGLKLTDEESLAKLSRLTLQQLNLTANENIGIERISDFETYMMFLKKKDRLSKEDMDKMDNMFSDSFPYQVARGNINVIRNRQEAMMRIKDMGNIISRKSCVLCYNPYTILLAMRQPKEEILAFYK